MLYRFTIINLQIDFHTIMFLRMAQVLFMPFIFIPISTLNYVGVPREKNNQVSGLSNFARNLGGSIGTSVLGTFLARQNQIHQIEFCRAYQPRRSEFRAMDRRAEGGLPGAGLRRGYSRTRKRWRWRMLSGARAGQCA